MKRVGAFALAAAVFFAGGCTDSKQSATTEPAADSPGTSPAPTSDAGGSVTDESGAPSPSVPVTDETVEPPTPGLSPAEADAVLAAFDFTNGASQLALFDARSDAALIEAAVRALMGGVAGDPLWAATFVCVNGCGDPAPLLPLIDNRDVTIRIMAATGLVARGRPEGYSPLVDALVDEMPVRGVEPPVAAWASATGSLVRFTGLGELGPPLDATPAQRLAAQERWRAWLTANGATFTFDAEEAYEQVIGGLDLISRPSRPQPLSGDAEITIGRYEHRGSCDAVRAVYQSADAPVPAGSVVTINDGGNVEVEAPFGSAGAVMAPSASGGCEYEVFATPSLVVDGADVPVTASFSNVNCSSLLGSDLIGADYQAGASPYFVYAFTGEAPETWTVVLGPGTIADVLQNPDSVPESSLTAFTTTPTRADLRHYVFDGAGPAGPVHVELRCTPYDEP